jgi:hypothetical protein
MSLLSYSFRRILLPRRRDFPLDAAKETRRDFTRGRISRPAEASARLKAAKIHLEHLDRRGLATSQGVHFSYGLWPLDVRVFMTRAAIWLGHHEQKRLKAAGQIPTRARFFKILAREKCQGAAAVGGAVLGTFDAAAQGGSLAIVALCNKCGDAVISISSIRWTRDCATLLSFILNGSYRSYGSF